MKSELLVGILLMSIVMSACITPLPSSTPAAKSDQQGTFKLEPGEDIYVVALWPDPTPVAAEVQTVTDVWPWSGTAMDIHTWAFWGCPKSMMFELTPDWNYVGTPYALLVLQPLFRDLQLWFEVERKFLKRPVLGDPSFFFY